MTFASPLSCRNFTIPCQARSSMPSNFDCDLGFTLGCTAAALVASGATAYMATAHCLTTSPSGEGWAPSVPSLPLWTKQDGPRLSGCIPPLLIPKACMPPLLIPWVCMLHPTSFRLHAKSLDYFCLRATPLDFCFLLCHLSHFLLLTCHLS